MSQPPQAHPSISQPMPSQQTPQPSRQVQQAPPQPFPTDPLQANRFLILKELRRSIHEVSQSVSQRTHPFSTLFFRPHFCFHLNSRPKFVARHRLQITKHFRLGIRPLQIPDQTILRHKSPQKKTFNRHVNATFKRFSNFWPSPTTLIVIM
jgi:hypothetical protein